MVAMTLPQTAESAPQDRADKDALWDETHRQLTISDGQGGILSLDLSQSGLDELADACNALLMGKLPPGACLMRVWIGDEPYLLRRLKHTPDSIGIARLGAQAQEVSLTSDVLRLVIELIEQTRHMRPPATGHARLRLDS
jgi:hypothetical protein